MAYFEAVSTKHTMEGRVWSRRYWSARAARDARYVMESSLTQAGAYTTRCRRRVYGTRVCCIEIESGGLSARRLEAVREGSGSAARVEDDRLPHTGCTQVDDSKEYYHFLRHGVEAANGCKNKSSGGNGQPGAGHRAYAWEQRHDPIELVVRNGKRFGSTFELFGEEAMPNSTRSST